METNIFFQDKISEIRYLFDAIECLKREPESNDVIVRIRTLERCILIVARSLTE
jgi:hypothetical protein